MDAAGLDFFLTHCEQRYFAPCDVLVQPSDGVVQQIFFIRQGAVTGVRGLADLSGGAFQYEAGESIVTYAFRPVGSEQGVQS